MATWSRAAPPAGSLAAAAAEMKLGSPTGPPHSGFPIFLVHNRYMDRCNIARRRIVPVSEVTESDGAETARTSGAADLTIDELAQRTGMTVRNIRAHQSRGLLPPPEVRGRTGFYGPDHVARIELIQ